MDFTFDTKEMVTRILKYLVEGLVVAFVAYILPSKSLTGHEVIILALVAASIFSVLDLLAPAFASSTRQGVGLGIGFNLIGFP